jgi:hypothetical protein
LGVTRRIFVGGVAGVCWPRREHLVLEAIAAERMPHRMVLNGVARSPFFELRDYGVEGTRVLGILNRCGIGTVMNENGRLLFAFDSLVAREKAWRELGAHQEWIAVRQSANLNEIAVYRTL